MDATALLLNQHKLIDTRTHTYTVFSSSLSQRALIMLQPRYTKLIYKHWVKGKKLFGIGVLWLLARASLRLHTTGNRRPDFTE